MNPKIMKLRGELEKNKGKISDLQGRNRELEKQIRELEDTDIIGMVRENGKMCIRDRTFSFPGVPPLPNPSGRWTYRP